MPDFRFVAPFQPTGDQPQAIERLTDGLAKGLNHQVLLGATGTGKTLTIAKIDRGGQPTDPRPRPQQDARRAALRRVPRLLPGQRGRVLRQLLRLLPARGIPAPQRHVHREGLAPERRDRPAAPRRDALPVRAPRRHRRRVGELHLRHRRAGRLRRDRPQAAGRRLVPPRQRAPAPGRPAVPAQRRGPRPRPVPRPRRHARVPAGQRGDASSASSSSATTSSESPRSTR